MKIFDDKAKEVFARAKFPLKDDEALLAQCVEILSNKMALVSPMGLTKKRVREYERQVESLVEDLIKMKADPNCEWNTEDGGDE